MLSEGREEYWFDDAGQITVYHQRDQLGKAKAGLREEGKSITLGRVLVALTFGFWKAMLNKQHENLWQTVLHKAVGERTARSR